MVTPAYRKGQIRRSVWADQAVALEDGNLPAQGADFEGGSAPAAGEDAQRGRQ
ncbi:MAG: hypothetical protein HY821_18355 [Acidobacteria bacterium]|nr:hypothetical protein [Acidobacteriota bacterium]